MKFTGHSDRKVLKKVDLQMTPMIDCVFLLLIFFMVGMKFREFDRRLDADLPKAGQTADTLDLKQELWIRIAIRKGTEANPQPQYFVDQKAMNDEKHLLTTLIHYANMPGSKNDPVIIAPTDDAQHGWVMTVLDYLNRLHFKSINFKQ